MVLPRLRVQKEDSAPSSGGKNILEKLFFVFRVVSTDLFWVVVVCSGILKILMVLKEFSIFTGKKHS